MKPKENERPPSCINCFHCKMVKNIVFCKFDHFTETNIKKIILFTPYEFECGEWESMDE